MELEEIIKALIQNLKKLRKLPMPADDTSNDDLIFEAEDDLEGVITTLCHIGGFDSLLDSLEDDD